jgi:archaemetzincin
LFRAIHLVRVGRPDGRGLPPLEWLDQCALRLARRFQAACRVREEIIDATPAFDAHRLQYQSSALLPVLAAIEAPAVLGLTTFDLFVPILTFVFGEAQLRGKAALVSTCRLQEEFYGLPANPSRFLDRLEVEAVHELGHTLGLRHCDDWNCAMSSSHAVERIDIKQASYCEACLRLLSAAPAR